MYFINTDLVRSIVGQLNQKIILELVQLREYMGSTNDNFVKK